MDCVYFLDFFIYLSLFRILYHVPVDVQLIDGALEVLEPRVHRLWLVAPDHALQVAHHVTRVVVVHLSGEGGTIRTANVKNILLNVNGMLHLNSGYKKVDTCK